MNPNENQNGQQAAYGVNSTPQQNTKGQYDVLPTPSVTGRPTGHNPYEFIVKPQAPKKKLPIPGSNSFLGKIGLFLGGFVLILTVLGIVLSSVFSRSDATPELTTVVQTQQELVRIASGGTFADSQSVQDAATTITLSVTSDQQKLNAYLSSHGVELDKKQLALGRNAKSDEILAAAKTTNTYNSALTQVMSDDLTAYQQAIEAAFKKVQSKVLKADLQQYYTNTFLLAEQLKHIQN